MFQTVDGYAEQAAQSLADVARFGTHTCQFEQAIQATSPAWYRDGMQLFAYTPTGSFKFQYNFVLSVVCYNNYDFTRLSRIQMEQERPDVGYHKRIEIRTNATSG